MKEKNAKTARVPSLVLMQLGALAVLTLITVSISWWRGDYRDGFFKDIMANVHAMLIEFFILGILILSLQSRIEARSQNRRYKEEIDDLRKWSNEFAARRLRGNIRRLNSNGEHQLDLSDCYLQGVDLSGVDLSASDLTRANLTEVDLRDADLRGANLQDAELIRTDMRGANLQGVNLKGAALFEADLRGASLEGADLQGADTRFVKTDAATYDDHSVFPATMAIDKMNKRVV